MKTLHLLLAALALCAFARPGSAQPGTQVEVNELLTRIKAVGREGRGNVEAAKAWRELVDKGPEAMVYVLEGFDENSPVSANWLRTAVDAIAERTLAARKPLPAGDLEAFVRDTRRSGAARKIAYDWLVRVDTSAPDRLLPGMLNDPGRELRRESVAVVMKSAQKAFDDSDKSAVDLYRKALGVVRDRDQLTLVAERLKKLGVEVDLTQQFGFITRWMLTGPFDNVKGVGFSNVYPPEKGVDLTATYVCKDNKKCGWTEHVTKENLGLVDLNKAVGALHGTVAYAYTVVSSPMERPVQLRAASNNAVRIFLNGKEVFFRDEYHHGMQMDQHIGKGILKAGRNEILVKVCQNEQTESWAQQWSFQLRLCDEIGGAVPVTVLNEKGKE